MSRNVSLDSPTPTEQFRWLFAIGREERFQTGMESHFSRTLLSLIDQHGESSFEILQELIFSPMVSIDVAAEACRWIGYIRNTESHTIRRKLLESVLLAANSAFLRDDASLALASMDDPASIPVLQQAVERETNSELRHDLQHVLDQLIETQQEQL